MSMRKWLLSIFLFVFVFSGMVYAQDEEITLTTYYPAPYGDYDMLTLLPMNGAPTDPAPNGAMYFDDGSHASRERGLYIYDSTDGGWVHAAERFGVPTGTIVMWSGSVASIPAGWHLCDGSAAGIPDLRERFIVGAGGNNPHAETPGTGYNVGDTGGEVNHILTTAEVPDHTHTGTAAAAGSEHRHHLQYGTRWIDLPALGSAIQAHMGNSNPIDKYTDIDGAHTHTVTTTSSDCGDSVTGAASAHENRPPYYALCFIMKL